MNTKDRLEDAIDATDEANKLYFASLRSTKEQKRKALENLAKAAAELTDAYAKYVTDL